MDSTNQQFGEFQHFTASLPHADCALVNQAHDFGTSQQLQHLQPPVSCEQPLYSHHSQLQQPQLQPQHHMHEYQEPQHQLREHQQPQLQRQLQHELSPSQLQQQQHRHYSQQHYSQQQYSQQQYPQRQQYPQLEQPQQQLQQQQRLTTQEEASPVTGDSLIRMAFTFAAEEQPSVAAPRQPQIQAQSAFLSTVHDPPAAQPADDIIASLDQAAALPGSQQQNPVAGAAALVQEVREALTPLPAKGSFGEHIGRAFMEAEENRLHLHDLYGYFLNKFSGLDPEDSKWKGSVRNKLSTSECFVKRIEKVGGKPGGTWSVRHDYLESFRNGIFHSSTRKKKPLTEEEENAQLEHILPTSCMTQYADVLRNYTHVTPISSEQVLGDLVRKYGKKVVCG